jgi:hypothetical protein
MDLKKKLGLRVGQRLEVVWIDHDEMTKTKSRTAKKSENTILHSYGKFVEENNVYLILAYNFEGPNSNNNDNMRIIKTEIRYIYSLDKRKSIYRRVKK